MNIIGNYTLSLFKVGDINKYHSSTSCVPFPVWPLPVQEWILPAEDFFLVWGCVSSACTFPGSKELQLLSMLKKQAQVFAFVFESISLF